jgi:hypothetical protein
MRRNFLGTCLYGKFVLRANDNGWDLYWVGKGHPLAALDRNLRNRVSPKRLTDTMFWLCQLPQGHYYVEPDRSGVGCELFKILPAFPLPAPDKPMVPPSPLEALFGRAVLPPPPPRQPIFISRPTA